jgi:hypothetical protein
MQNHKHSLQNINMKVSSMGGISGGSHTHSFNNYHSQTDHLFQADIALTYRKGGHLNIIKNRYDIPVQNISVDEAAAIFSKILSGMCFKDNDLVMFKEGLKKQIESAIKIAIKTFHESR